MKYVKLIKDHRPKIMPPQEIEEARPLVKDTSRIDRVHVRDTKDVNPPDVVSVQYAMLWIGLCVTGKTIDNYENVVYSISATEHEQRCIEIRTGIKFKLAVTYWRRYNGKVLSKFKKNIRTVLIQEYRELSVRKINGDIVPLARDEKIFIIDRALELDKLERAY